MKPKPKSMSHAALALIARRFNIPQDAITDIANLDGTNEVYSFSIGGGEIPPELVNAQKEIDALLSRLTEMKPPQVLCHGDACSPNCLRLKDGSLRLIDWEQAGMADPLVDIAVSAVHSGLEKPELHLERYLQRTPLTEELFRLRAYIALHCFAWAWWSLQIQENEEYHNHYETGLEYMQGLLV